MGGAAVFGNLVKAPQLVCDQVFFLQEIERRGGVVLTVDVDAGVEFLYLFVVKQLRKGSEELFNLWVLVQDLGPNNRGKVVLRKERIRVCP